MGLLSTQGHSGMRSERSYPSTACCKVRAHSSHHYQGREGGQAFSSQHRMLEDDQAAPSET